MDLREKNMFRSIAAAAAAATILCSCSVIDSEISPSDYDMVRGMKKNGSERVRQAIAVAMDDGVIRNTEFSKILSVDIAEERSIARKRLQETR